MNKQTLEMITQIKILTDEHNQPSYMKKLIKAKDIQIRINLTTITLKQTLKTSIKCSKQQ